jgi:uncharacterized membrane protein YphA (DoxX/SURF4 family)
VLAVIEPGVHLSADKLIGIDEEKYMKIAVIIVRVLMGLLFLFASITFLFNLIPVPPMTGPVKTFNEGLAASVYFFPLLKVTELLCGLAFVSGRYVALACVIISPIIINILFIHIFLDRQGLPIAIALVLANIFLAYANWDKYRPLLAAK